MISIAGNHAKQKGYSLVVVMVAVIIMGIIAESAITLESYQVKKSREDELLFRGMAYQNAILSYLNASNSQQRRYPQRLEDLISDPRFAFRRHLRHLYPDPMVQSAKQDLNIEDIKDQWRLLRNDKGGIIGISSKSSEKPLKKAFFPTSLSHFSKAKRYSDWVFEVL